MPGSGEENSRSLILDQKSQEPVVQVTSKDLPKNVSMQLYDLMKQVTAKKVNASTVRAACLCATEIHRMLKLNEDVKRGSR